jgi:predicted outer membrane repeat protein
MKRILTLLASLSLVAGFFAATPAPAKAQEGWVDVAHDGDLTGGSCKTPDYHSIQDAIDDGQHYIYICNGVYKEHITNDESNDGDDQPIHLWGQNQLKTILDGTGNGRVYDSTAGIYLESLTIRNGSTTGEGGGVFTSTFVNCSYVTFDNNDADIVGGAVSADGAFTADHCTFKNNSSAASGGAVAAASITDNYGTYIYNSAEYGGGAIAAQGSFNLTNSTFTYNWTDNADGEGGAVAANGGPNYVANSVFRSNQAGDSVDGDGGAIVVNNSDDTTIVGSSFVSNTAGGYGGALAVSDLYLAASGRRVNIFQGNHAGTGGAIAADDVEISGGQFTGNVADHTAGVIFATIVTVANASFTSNTATNGAGGAISAMSVAARTTTFAKNEACGFGGAISALGVGIGRSTFTDNNVDTCDGDARGGAIYADLGGIVEGSTFARNTSEFVGGALFAGEAINISRSTFKDNYAGEFAGAVLVGSVSVGGETTTTISSSSFIANSAGLTAGAIGISNPAALVLRGNLLQGNRVVNFDGPAPYFPGETPYAGTGAVEVLTDASEGFTAIPLTISGNRFIGNTGMLTGGFSFVSVCSSSVQRPSTAMLRSNTWKSNVGIYTQDLLSYALVGTTVSANSDYLALATEYCGGD